MLLSLQDLPNVVNDAPKVQEVVKRRYSVTTEPGGNQAGRGHPSCAEEQELGSALWSLDQIRSSVLL